MGLFGIETGAESDFGDSLRRQASGMGPSPAASMLNANTMQVQRNMAGMAQQRSGVNSALAYRNAMTAGGDLAAQNAQTAATARAQEQLNAQGLYGQWLQQQSKNANAGMGALLGGAGAMGSMLTSDERAKTQVAPGGNAADDFMTAALHARDQRAALMPQAAPPTGQMVMHGGPPDVRGVPMQAPVVYTGPSMQDAARAVRPLGTQRNDAYQAGILAAQQARAAVPLEQAAQPHTYQYRDQARFGGGENLGVMAQDMAQVAPGMVQQGPDGLLHVDTGRLAGATAAATGRLHDRLSQVEAVLAAQAPDRFPRGAVPAQLAGAGAPAAIASAPMPPSKPTPPPPYEVTMGPAVMDTPQFGRSLRHGPMRYHGAR